MASGRKGKGSPDESRRDFMKGAVGTLVAGATLVGSRREAHAQGANQRAVLPDGKAYSRAELLGRLGLNPNTPPEAWITITCGVNAAGLGSRDAQQLLRAGKLKEQQLSPAQQRELKIQPGQMKGLEKKAQPR